MVDNTASPSTGGDELQIPKHRFDEVNNELRRIREEMATKDKLYLSERQQQMAQATRQQQVADPTPEETGLDPQTHQAVMKAAKIIAAREVGQLRAGFEQQIGILADRTESAQFIATKGSDKAAMMPEITRFQQEHYATTGSYISKEIAYDVIRSRQLEDKVKQLEAKAAGQPAPATQSGNPASVTSQSTHSAPPAAGSRQMPGAAPVVAAPTGAKSFGGLSLEEMEAQLDQQFTSGERL